MDQHTSINNNNLTTESDSINTPTPASITTPNRKSKLPFIFLFIPFIIFLMAIAAFYNSKNLVSILDYSISNLGIKITQPLNSNSHVSSTGTMFAQDKERTGEYIGVGVSNKPSVLWTFTTDHKPSSIGAISSAISSSIIVAENKVFFSTLSGDIYALDIKTGEKLWKTSSACTGNNTTPAYTDFKLFIGNNCDGISAYRAKDGKLIWNFNPIKKGNNNSIHTDNRFSVASSPVVTDGKVFVGTQDGVYALDINSGKTFLHISKAGVNTVAMNDKFIFSNDELGQLYANDITSGQLIWSKKVSSTTLFSYPVVAGSTVLLANDNGDLFAFDAETGQSKWTYSPCLLIICKFSNKESPAVDSSTAYAIWDSGKISAVDLVNGREKWETNTGEVYTFSPLINNGTIYLTTINDNYIYALDSKTGQKKWEYSVPPLQGGLGDSISNPASIFNGVIYFGTKGGIIYALH